MNRAPAPRGGSNRAGPGKSTVVQSWLVEQRPQLEWPKSHYVAVQQLRRIGRLTTDNQWRATTQMAHGHLRFVEKQISVGFRKGQIAKHQVAVAGRADEEQVAAHRADSLLHAAARDLDRHTR